MNKVLQELLVTAGAGVKTIVGQAGWEEGLRDGQIHWCYGRQTGAEVGRHAGAAEGRRGIAAGYVSLESMSRCKSFCWTCSNQSLIVESSI